MKKKKKRKEKPANTTILGKREKVGKGFKRLGEGEEGKTPLLKLGKILSKEKDQQEGVLNLESPLLKLQRIPLKQVNIQDCVFFFSI